MRVVRVWTWVWRYEKGRWLCFTRGMLDWDDVDGDAYVVVPAL